MLGEEAYFKDVDWYFEGGLELWSRKDSIHLSTDHGLPRLILCIIDGHEEVDDLYEHAHQKMTEAAERCPALMWLELRHHNPLGNERIYSRCYVYFLLQNDTIMANPII